MNGGFGHARLVVSEVTDASMHAGTSAIVSAPLRTTVVVCAHNEERHLPGCLHSLLAQTHPPDELLVINNASTDATGAVAYVANSDFHKPKHRYSWKTLLRCEKNWPAIKRALRGNVDIALTLFRNGEWAAD